MACGSRYDSHQWGWVDGRHVCGDCGVEDLGAARITRSLLAQLRRRGLVLLALARWLLTRY